MFMKYKEELYKTNRDLYNKFFEDLESTELEVKNVYGDDEVRFLFFFNKRKYLKLTVSDSHLIFPRVRSYY